MKSWVQELFHSVAGHGHWALASSWLVLEPSRDARRHRNEHFTQIKRGEVGFAVQSVSKGATGRCIFLKSFSGVNECQSKWVQVNQGHGKLYKWFLVFNVLESLYT